MVVTQEIVYPRVHPAPMETCGAVADSTRSTGKLTLWSTSQAPHAHRTLYALVAGLPEHKIRVIAPDIGGGFGNKVPIYPGYVCAIVGSLVLGKPVKWMEDRSENLMSTGFARDYIMRRRDRRHHGRQDPGDPRRTCSPTTARSTAPPRRSSTRPASSACSPAATTSRPRTATMTAVYTNKAPGGVAYACSFRITEAVYLVERLVDCLAHELKMDPARAAAGEPAEARAVPVHVQDRLGLRLRRLRDRHAAGAWRWPATTTLRARAGGDGASAAS